MRRPLLVAAAAALALSVIAMPGAGAAPAHESGGPVFTGETTKSILPAKIHAQAGKPGGGQPITYHRRCGHDAGVTAYYIYYGDWSGGGPADSRGLRRGHRRHSVLGHQHRLLRRGEQARPGQRDARQGGHSASHRPRQRPLRRQHPDHREQRDHQRSAAQRPERRLLPAHRARASRRPAGSSPSTAAGTPTPPSAAPRSSTPSSATPPAEPRELRRSRPGVPQRQPAASTRW